MDARPSDAINLAVRCGAPIYINKEVVSASAYAITANGTATKVHASRKVKRLDSVIDLRMQLAVAVAQRRLADAEVLSRLIAAKAGADGHGAALILEMERAIVEERYADAAALRDRLAALNPEVQQDY